jgi:biopolymer transport protein ExbB/TolQ
MQPGDFTTTVLPLGISIVILVAVIMVMESRKEAFQDKKIKRAVEKLSKEKQEKEQAFRNEQAELDRLHQANSIDNDTYKRLSTLMQMNAKNYEETMNSLINADNIIKKPKAKHKPKMAAPPQIGF